MHSVPQHEWWYECVCVLWVDYIELLVLFLCSYNSVVTFAKLCLCYVFALFSLRFIQRTFNKPISY